MNMLDYRADKFTSVVILIAHNFFSLILQNYYMLGTLVDENRNRRS